WCEIQVRTIRRAHDRTILVVTVGARARPKRPFGLVRVELRQDLRHRTFELPLVAPRVDRDAKRLDLRTDLLEHRLHGIAVTGGDLVDVLAHVAALGRILAAPSCLDRLSKELDLPAGIVEVVLLLDLVPG